MHPAGRQPIRQAAHAAVLELLNATTSGRGYPDRLTGGLFRRTAFSDAEKAAITEMLYGILRHRGRLDYIIEHSSRAVPAALSPAARNILRLAAYQALSGLASPAGIINSTVALSSKDGKLGGFLKRTAEAVLRNKDSVSFPDRGPSPLEFISLYHSHPAWIVEKWLHEIGDARAVESLCSANNLAPPLTIRANPHRTTVPDLRKLLLDEGYPSAVAAFSPCGIAVEKKEGIFKTRAFARGLFEVQDEGSQLITMLCGAKSGELVIDACAGYGGKSLFLSGLMGNRGTVLASDLHAAKLGNLRRRAARAGASNIRTVDVTAIMEYASMADCVLIDAPCSGMGVFRRNPDSKWRLSEEDIPELSAKQHEIIRNYSRLVKPGGRLVYATCTISRDENDNIVERFLEDAREFAIVPAIEVNAMFRDFTDSRGYFRSFPHIHGTDGFFCAVMRRQAHEVR